MQVKKKDRMYYARILPTADVYDVCDLIIRTVEDDWFVGMDKRDKHAYLFQDRDVGVSVFFDRNIALKKVTEAEQIFKKERTDDYVVDRFDDWE